MKILEHQVFWLEQTRVDSINFKNYRKIIYLTIAWLFGDKENTYKCCKRNE